MTRVVADFLVIYTIIKLTFVSKEYLANFKIDNESHLSGRHCDGLKIKRVQSITRNVGQRFQSFFIRNPFSPYEPPSLPVYLFSSI